MIAVGEEVKADIGGANKAGELPRMLVWYVGIACALKDTNRPVEPDWPAHDEMAPSVLDKGAGDEVRIRAVARGPLPAAS